MAVPVDPAAGTALPVRLAVPAVALGGVLGALARHGVTAATGSPWGTLLVNLTGCLLLGLLVGARRQDQLLRAFAGTGVLGGFTTMSAFAVEVDRLALTAAVAYAAASALGGLALARAGLRWGSRA